MSEENLNVKGRQFICSCGKNYLSYAALFTHIKQKHDGKPPGPIIRPRSERKRGRPRKNPLVQNQSENQQQDQPQNGISRVIDNNNIQKKEQQQQKTKKAAELLVGRGGFVAFTAYKPQSIRSPTKKVSQSAKKNMSKKNSVIDSIERKGSNAISLFNQKQQFNSIANISPQQEKLTFLNFCQSLELTNKEQLRKIFSEQSEDNKVFPTGINELKLLKQLDIRVVQTKIDDLQSIVISQGLCQFLKYISQITKENLNENHQHNQNQMKQLANNSSIEQVQAFISFLLDYVCETEGGSCQQIKKKQFYDITNYLQTFLSCYLPEKISHYELDSFNLFKNLNPVKFVLFLGNWLVIKKTYYEISNKYKQEPTKDNGEIHQKIYEEHFKFEEDQMHIEMDEVLDKS